MSIWLDGTDQRAKRTSTPITGYPMSLVGWFKADDDLSLETILAIADTTTDTQYFWALYRGNLGGDPVAVGVRAGGSDVLGNKTTGGASGAWHHIAAIFTSATDREIYYDGGTPETEGTDTTPTGVDAIGVGAKPKSGGGFDTHFAGKIAHAAIYSTALDSTDVTDLQTKAPNLVQAGSLEGHWFKSDGIDGTDLSGNSITLTLDNSPTFDVDDNPSVTEDADEQRTPTVGSVTLAGVEPVLDAGLFPGTMIRGS